MDIFDFRFAFRGVLGPIFVFATSRRAMSCHAPLASPAVARPVHAPPRRAGTAARAGPTDRTDAAPEVSRRSSFALLAGVAGLASAHPARAVDLSAYAVSARDDLDIAPVDTSDWAQLESGVRFVVERASAGNVERGITDPVSYYVPNPFVEVRYTAYAASTGKAFASSEAARRPYNFQAGVKDEVQDEAGGVPEMFVGEKRRFVVPAELCFKRRVFGQTAPKDDDVLIDVELLALQPY